MISARCFMSPRSVNEITRLNEPSRTQIPRNTCDLMIVAVGTSPGLHSGMHAIQWGHQSWVHVKCLKQWIAQKVLLHAFLRFRGFGQCNAMQRLLPVWLYVSVSSYQETILLKSSIALGWCKTRLLVCFSIDVQPDPPPSPRCLKKHRCEPTNLNGI